MQWTVLHISVFGCCVVINESETTAMAARMIASKSGGLRHGIGSRGKGNDKKIKLLLFQN